MTHEQMLGIAADLAAYVIECSYDGYPFVTQPNGDVTYTEEAQDLFNKHFDIVFNMIEDNKESEQPRRAAEMRWQYHADNDTLDLY